MKITDINELKRISKEIRKSIVTQVYKAQSGHPGGSLSIADILTVLYFNEMNIDEKNPKWEERDRLVLSKGHCSPALYSCLANRGFFEKEKLQTFRNIESKLQGHPDMHKTPGVDMSTGSLGQGISTACGMALAAKKDGLHNTIYALLGDGETEEGEVWEAAMFAAHYQLDNLIAFLDHNHLQIDGNPKDVLSPEPLNEKCKSPPRLELIFFNTGKRSYIIGSIVFEFLFISKPNSKFSCTVICGKISLPCGTYPIPI